MPRRKERIITRMDVIINDSIRALAFDMNEDGMYLYTTEGFVPDEIVNLSFDMGPRHIETKASIRHVDSGFGFGVKFLDLAPEDYFAISKSLSTLVSMGKKHTIKIVLLIDDNAKSRSSNKQRLQQDGLVVLEAENGADALKVFQMTKPDMVVMEHPIARINTWKLLQYMRSKAELRDMPVIVIADKFVAEELETMLALGIKEYLVKAMTTPGFLSGKIKKFFSEAPATKKGV